jgi:YegS/Rv2252/BmrU family lipid kinase
VRICVIFNPTARGEKAKRFRQNLDRITPKFELKPTTGPGDARRLAAEAVLEGYTTVVAAGGDGTVNEVLNGLGDVPDGFASTQLGILPLGTVNVFARELGVSTKLETAWKTICEARERKIDLPVVRWGADEDKHLRYFAQLAGAGLDARAIELVKWQIKKKIGPLAYVLAGLHAVCGSLSKIQASSADDRAEGELVLIGNGRLYGGQFAIFPRADLNDGLLEVCVIPRVNWLTLARCAPRLLLRGTLPDSVKIMFRAKSISLQSTAPTPLEVDGELIGNLPATFSIHPEGLRVIAP